MNELRVCDLFRGYGNVTIPPEISQKRIFNICVSPGEVNEHSLLFLTEKVGDDITEFDCRVLKTEPAAIVASTNTRVNFCQCKKILVDNARSALSYALSNYYSIDYGKMKIIGVTGTNGKTTTCTMIDSVLKSAGINSVLCGNIGTPFISKVDKECEDSVFVVETSSFQLETVSAFCPHVAVITNVTPDHLSRHYNMENYLYVKSRILKNLQESEYAVLCYDDPLVQKLGEKAKAKILYFSAKTKVNGCYVESGKIYFKGKEIADLQDLPISGEHNILNFMATVCVAIAIGLSSEVIIQGIKSFKGVRHRIQHVATKRGVDYVNDSKATNIDATCKAIDTVLKPTVLILGGKDKGIAFDSLFEKIKCSRVKSVILTGESRYRLLDGALKAGYQNVSMVADFYTAIDLARLVAVDGDCVLLSPACSSFDMFSDFEQRGDEFVRYVESFNE